MENIIKKEDEKTGFVCPECHRESYWQNPDSPNSPKRCLNCGHVVMPVSEVFSSAVDVR